MNQKMFNLLVYEVSQFFFIRIIAFDYYTCNADMSQKLVSKIFNNDKYYPKEKIF